MLHVFALNDAHRDTFLRLFKEYYAELDCDDDAVRLAEEIVLPDLLAGLLQIDMIEDDGETVGFVIYQIDDIDNEWCFREGWGDVREIFISPSFRRRGSGKFLLYTAEMKLKERGAQKSYCLPVEDAVGFFTACGYAETNGYNDELECPVYEKHDLNNGDCGKRERR